MKGMDLFCSSSASTAVISSMNKRSTSRRSPKTYPRDRRITQLHVPCSSHLPINPKPYFERHRKSSADHNKQNGTTEVRRKSSADIYDLYTTYPIGSSRRYLLSDAPFIDWASEADQIPTMVPVITATKPTNMNKDVSPPPAFRSSSSARSTDQVVVLRVSLHCKGCEAKVRKHLSKMEGVTSFSIDRETKKVTVIGNVTPLGVLASVSKVKNAQLWPSPTSSSSSSSQSSSSSSSAPSSPWST